VPSPAPFHTFENPPKLNATANRVGRLIDFRTATTCAPNTKKSNLRLALVLASVVAVFFLGFVLKMACWEAEP
jgi:hypothetical protein